MEYRITITKLVENPTYDPAYSPNNSYSPFNESKALKVIEETALLSEITEEQFAAVRKALIEVL